MIVTLIYLLYKIIVVLLLLFIIISIAITAYIKFKFEPVKGICKSTARLDNKVVLVTGGNQGIGLETARDLAARGARVIIASRDEKKSAEAVADIIRTTDNKNVEYKYLDLSTFRSIRQFVEEFNSSYDRLDILINNAGCAVINHRATEEGVDIVMQVNYLGPFLLTYLLLDKIKTSEAGRIVIVSSVLHLLARMNGSQVNGMHTKCPLFKYNNSKLCDVLWTKALAKRLPSNVTVNVLHPGGVITDIFKSIPLILRNWVLFLLKLFRFKTPKEGAQTTIYLAVSEEVSGLSGKYFMECKEAEYSRAADDEELVEQVWNESVRLSKLSLQKCS